jgi:hypothetical protein
MSATILKPEDLAKCIQVTTGRDGTWITLKTASGKSFSFQPIQEWPPENHWRKYVVEWCNELQSNHDNKTPV